MKKNDYYVNEFINKIQKFLNNNYNLNWDVLIDQFKFEQDLQTIPDDLSKNLSNIFHHINEINFLQPFIIKEHISEILLYNNKEGQIDDGTSLLPISLHLSQREFQVSLENLSIKRNISWNFSTPFASFYASLFNVKLRITLIHFSITADNFSKVSLRKLSSKNLSLTEFAIPSSLAAELNDWVHKKSNILISGHTGSGKTTFLKEMILKIPSNEHVIILEDTHELITTRPNHTTLIAKDSNSNNSLKDFVSYSMRMRPDRIIVGEMRSHEIVPLLLAINSGHRGVMSTIHSNSARDSLSKTALLFTLFSKQAELSFNLVLKIVCTNIDYVIHLEKRKIKEIIKVFGSEDSTPSFERIYEATKL